MCAAATRSPRWCSRTAVVAARSAPRPKRISQEQLAWDLAHIASDDTAGRNTPSPGFDAAADYITTRLRKAGLQPAGEAGTFRQHYEMHESRVDTDAASIAIDGHSVRVRPRLRDAIAGGARLSGELPVVYAGHGWVIADRTSIPTPASTSGASWCWCMVRVLPRGVDVQQIGRMRGRRAEAVCRRS